MNREIGAALLTLVGCQVDIAENGQQAVDAKAAVGGYDIILMDIHMPRWTAWPPPGPSRPWGPAGKIPIIAMSADALPQQVERCYAAGMVDHIAKPDPARGAVRQGRALAGRAAHLSRLTLFALAPVRPWKTAPE
jgi:CheY-like chemotaxis protein